MQRARPREFRNQPFDVAVVGGGLVGTAIARDAAMRGFRTLLVEKADFASGSTLRLPHLMGGVALYYDSRDLASLRHLERERRLLMQLAPHLIRPINCLFAGIGGLKPAIGWRRRISRLLDSLGFIEEGLGSLKPLSGKRLETVWSSISPQRVPLGFQTLDALLACPQRLCLENTLSAFQNGAQVLNYAQVVSVQVHNRQVRGLLVEDRMTGKNIQLETRCLINAAGPWLDQVCQMADDRYISRLRRRRETYLVLPQLASRLDQVVLFPVREGRQILEVIPLGEEILLGPAVGEAEASPESCRGSEEEVDFLLSGAESLLSGEGWNRLQILRAITGVRIRPTDSPEPPALRGSRPWVVDHGKAGGPRGLVSVAGGKWAYCRLAAAEAVDAARSYAGMPQVKDSPAHTESLFGGNMPAIESYLEEVAKAARNFDLNDEQVRHLVFLYGNKSQEIFQWLKNDPDLRDRICPHQPDIKAQLLYAVEREMAVTVGDIFLRRTVIGHTRCRGLDCCAVAARTLARQLNWSEARITAEIENYKGEQESLYWKPA